MNPVSSTLVLEIVVFVASPDVDSAWASAHEALTKLPGYHHALRLRSPTKDNLRADIVAWDSYEAAKAAAAKFERNPQFRPFMQKIVSVTHMGHYRGPRDLVAALARAPWVEIALYKTVDPARHEALHSAVHARLDAQPEVVAHAPLVAYENREMVADLIGWTDKEAFETTGAKFTKDPELKPFFDNVKPPDVFELFIPVTADRKTSSPPASATEVTR